MTQYIGLDTKTLATLLDDAEIYDALERLLTTPIGSRVMRREYGSLLPALIDQPMHGATLLRLTAATYTALLRWEPRIRIIRARFAPDATQPGRIVVDLQLVRTDQPGAEIALALAVPIAFA